MNSNQIFRLVLFFCVLVAGKQSIAQDKDRNSYESKSWDRFSIRLGGFLATYNSDVQVASKQVGLGIILDIEDVLGIKSSTFAFRGEMDYRFGKNQRHLFSAGYFGIFRNASKVLEEELEIGDEVYPVGSELKSRFDFTIIRAKYDYTFFQDSRVSLGASFGLFIVPMSLSVKTINFDDHQTKFTAPLPLIGLRSNFRISEKFYLNQSIEFLYLSFENYTGSILDLNIAVEHKSFKHVGFGLGVNSNRLKINIESEDSPINFYGDIGMDYTGLLIYIKYYL